jgi:DpnII restriction endonuclease
VRRGAARPLITSAAFSAIAIVGALVLPRGTAGMTDARIDFLLKAEGIVVETKMTRDGLTARRVGEELAIDAVR